MEAYFEADPDQFTLEMNQFELPFYFYTIMELIEKFQKVAIVGK